MLIILPQVSDILRTKWGKKRNSHYSGAVPIRFPTSKWKHLYGFLLFLIVCLFKSRAPGFEVSCFGVGVGMWSHDNSRCDHMIANFSCVVYNSCVGGIITLQSWVDKELLRGQGAIRVAETRWTLLLKHRSLTSRLYCSWSRGHILLLWHTETGLSLVGRAYADCRYYISYFCHPRRSVEWRESRWHYLRDRFTATLNYRAKLL